MDNDTRRQINKIGAKSEAFVRQTLTALGQNRTSCHQRWGWPRRRPTSPAGLPEQFDRTPYTAGFRAANEHFSLLTAHIRYGALPADRLPELQRIATYTANELRTRARTGQSREEPNPLVLGDFNIDKRQGNPLFDAFVEHGLWVPQALQGVKTTAGKVAKYFDQIAWFPGDHFGLRLSGRAGSIDFSGAVFQHLT